jgi:hypothetical protein
MKIFRRLLYRVCAPCRPHKSFTVRYAFPLVFTFVALLGAAAAIQSDTRSSIRLEISDTNVSAGERFEINVYASAKVAINAVDIQLQFPRNQIKVLGIDTGQSVITLWTQEPYVRGDKVYLQGGTFRRGFIGEHLIATINAEATETGLAQVSLGDVSLLAGDGSGAKVAVVATDNGTKQIYITENNGTLSGAVGETNLKLSSTAAVLIVTDIDGDGRVTLSDISRFMVAWANKSIIYDFNGDGQMTFRDFGIILSESFFR